MALSQIAILNVYSCEQRVAIELSRSRYAFETCHYISEHTHAHTHADTKPVAFIRRKITYKTALTMNFHIKRNVYGKWIKQE
jgi:hypothetical protein